MTGFDDDHSDPTFVLGAVLAQLEDLTLAEQRAVLLEAQASLPACPDHFVGAERLRCDVCGLP